LRRSKRRAEGGKAKRPVSRRKVATRQRSSGEDEAAAWYAGKSFSFDWTSWHFPNWIKLLKPYRGRSLRVLEIGSWEGRSALFFLNYLPRARLTCIDTFEGGKEHQVGTDSAGFLREVEQRFDANTAAFASRVEKIKAPSTTALAQLGVARRRFDLAYIDGSHLAADVYSDATLTWPLMVRGGLVIFDDYLWTDMPDPLDRPKPGIDAFLKAIEGEYRIVLDDYQVAIVKR
jgi:predicted O-methyltransferase YrrM